MKVYKFRSAETLPFVLDILLCRRLFCSSAGAQNDLLEGHIPYFQLASRMDWKEDYAASHRILDKHNAAAAEAREFNICSLTKTFASHLLWAHYAAGFRGFVIELDIDEAELWEVTYDSGTGAFFDLMNELSPSEMARLLLSRKRIEWEYESEVRLITQAPFYELKNPISRVITSMRVPMPVLRTMQLVCHHLAIPLDVLTFVNEPFGTRRIDPYDLNLGAHPGDA
jgi:hypothetical protein